MNMDGAAFFGYLVGALLVGAVIPILVGGFYPWGSRASSGRAAAAWAIALIWAVVTIYGRGSALAVAIAMIVVVAAFAINRRRPVKA